MAYCKECGAHVKDQQGCCSVCGNAVEQHDLIDRSQVEIVGGSGMERRRVLRAEPRAVDSETKEHAFAVFDKKIAILLGLVLLAQMLAFLIRSVDNGEVDVLHAVRSACYFVSTCIAVFAIMLKARVPLKIALWGMVVSAVVFLVIALLRIDISTAGKGVRWFSVLAVPIMIAVWSAVMLFEMRTGKRKNGLHIILIAIIAIAVLASIVTALLGDVEASIGDLAIMWQIFEMASKVFILCVVLMLYSNMGRLAVTDKY